MPDIETYTFTHRELLATLIKEADVHQGEWMLVLNFSFQAGNFGQDEDNVHPGLMAAVTSFGITKAKKGSPKSLVLNASEINPSAPTA